MFRKLFVTALMIGWLSVPMAAQSTYIELSYQSFKPYVHFQLNLGNAHHYYRDSYQSAYLKGYMDGVNDAYYNDYRFYELVRDIDIYEAGYRDGYRDRDLLIRLRGRSWYHRHRFVYDDYHAPYYSVQIWLDGLTFAFLQAPRHRLPDRWIHRVHPKVRRYRARMQSRKHYAHIEKRYRKRVKRLRKNARQSRSRYLKRKGRKNYRSGKIRRASTIDKKKARTRARSIERLKKRSRVRQYRGARSDRQARVKSSSRQKRRKAVRSHSKRRSTRQRSVRKAQKRQKNRGSVRRGKSSRKNKGRRSRGRNR